MAFKKLRNKLGNSVVLLVFLLTISADSLAANHYVWCGVSFNGDGTSLANPGGVGQTGAFNDLPSSLTRSDTYFVAGDPTCTYPPHTFNDAESSTSVISIVKVTSAQSGIPGYASAMATNPASWLQAAPSDPEGFRFPEWSICNSYYTFEGVIGSTDPIAGPGGQGFVLQASGYLVVGHVYIATNLCGGGTKTFTNIVLHHIEVRTEGADNYHAVPVRSCSYDAGTATISTNTPSWSQGWVVGDYVSGQTLSHLVAFGPSGNPPQIATANGNTFTLSLGTNPCPSLAYVEMDNSGNKGVGGPAIYAVGASNSFNGLDIQYDYLHSSSFDTIDYYNSNGQGIGSAVAHNYITGNLCWPQSHGQPIAATASSGLTVAYNFFLDGVGTAVVFNNGANYDATSTNMAFYGNIVTESGSNIHNAGYSALIEDYCTTPGGVNGLVVYNNTVFNTLNGDWDLNMGPSERGCGSRWTVSNNLWVNSVKVSLVGSAISQDYNTLLNTPLAGMPNGGTHNFQSNSGSTVPFVSSGSYNFGLVSDTGPAGCTSGTNCFNNGITLPSPYNFGFGGNVVNLTGSFDRGAYQLTPSPPNPPVNLQVTVR